MSRFSEETIKKAKQAVFETLTTEYKAIYELSNLVGFSWNFTKGVLNNLEKEGKAEHLNVKSMVLWRRK